MAGAARETRIPYLEIAADIREQIRSGRLVPGDKLRSLRSLAADYSVAQGTVGAAMEVLRAEGLIDTVQSKGSVVVAVPGEVPADPGRGETQRRARRTAGNGAGPRRNAQRSVPARPGPSCTAAARGI